MPRKPIKLSPAAARAIVEVAVAVLFLVVAAPAFAEWKVEPSQDKPASKVAWVGATDRDSGTQGRLEIVCIDDKLLGGLVVRLHTSARLPPDWMGLSYRIDDGPIENRHIQASAGSLNEWGDARAILKGKRIQIRLEPFNAPAMLFDFDGSGADAVKRAIPCEESHT
jgi:hypothetical protein